MANNFNVGPNAVVARQEVDGLSFDTVGFDNINCAEIFKAGNPSQSWVPGRSINTLSPIFQAGAGYWITMKVAKDYSAYFYPPITTTTPPPPPATYVQEVTADAPIYYNRLGGATATQAPTLGSGNATLVGGATPMQAGAVLGGNSVQFNGTDAYATLFAGLSLYTAIKLEFFLFKDSDYADGGVGAVHSGPSWASTDGTFVANVAGGSDTAFLGVNGGTGFSDSKSMPAPSKGVWHHYVYTINNHGIPSVLIDGVAAVITDSNPAPDTNTNTFADATMYFLGLGTTGTYGKGRLCEIAIYAGTIPPDSRFVIHYAARNN